MSQSNILTYPWFCKLYGGNRFGFKIIHDNYMNMYNLLNKLDELTARWQLKSPRSLSGRSIHLTMVTKWSWSWSWMTYCHPLCAMIQPFQNWTMKIYGQGHVCGQRSRSRLTFKIQRSGLWSRSNPLVTFEALEFNRYVCFSFCGNGTIFGWDIAKLVTWPWKFKVKVMAKVKPDGHIWALEFNPYVCFSICGNQTILAEI